MESNSKDSKYTSIKKIKVEKLFGDFTYELPDLNDENDDFSKVLILYGDNGSGKTTILKMLYHLLNPINRKGHKSFLAEIRFKTFEVQLTDGTTITAQRAGNSLIGSYTLILAKDSTEIESVFLKADDELSLQVKGRREIKLMNILEYISELDYALYFISDDRAFSSNIFELYEESDRFDYIIRDIGFERKYFTTKRQPQDLRGIIMQQAISRAEKYLISQVTEALSKGEINVNKIYSDLIKLIANPSKKVGIEGKSIKKLKNRLQNLFERSQEYSKFKIISPFEIKSIVDALNTAPRDEIRTINTVLKPYIEGIKAKLSALEGVYDLLETFINNLNNFYTHKIVEFKLDEGIVIKSKEQILNPNLLSSGEKQLLMLFCSVLLARDHNSIFAIDEPEISLNVKWQRFFIQALLDLTRNCQVQFILATHSIELLSQYHGNVAHLKQIE